MIRDGVDFRRGRIKEEKNESRGVIFVQEKGFVFEMGEKEEGVSIEVD